VISHGGFYNYLLKNLLMLPELDRVWFVLHNGAITRIDFRDPEAEGVRPIALVYTNRVDYLPSELVT